MLDPCDFIDPDEGRDEPVPFFTYGEPCENCGSACDAGTRAWVPGFDYWACDQYAEEARIAIFAEENCPTLYDAFQRSTSVKEISKAYDTHRASCPNCNPKISGLPLRRSVKPEGAFGTGERKQERAA